MILLQVVCTVLEMQAWLILTAFSRGDANEAAFHIVDTDELVRLTDPRSLDGSKSLALLCSTVNENPC